jgi:hypothetical protein
MIQVQFAIVGMGSDGCNVMLGSRNSVMTRLRTKQPSLVSFHCNCHVAALIANHACCKLRILPFKYGTIFTKALRGKGHLKIIRFLPSVSLISCLNLLKLDG